MRFLAQRLAGVCLITILLFGAAGCSRPMAHPAAPAEAPTTDGPTVSTAPRAAPSPAPTERSAAPANRSSTIRLDPDAVSFASVVPPDPDQLEAARSLDPNTVVRETLAALDPKVLGWANLAPLPKNSSYGFGRFSFFARYTAAKDDAQHELYGEWLAELAQGTVADRLATSADLNQTVRMSAYDAVLPDGTRVHGRGGGQGDTAAWQQFTNTASDSEIESATKTELGAHHLHLVSARVFHPLGTAVAVIARAVPGADLTGSGRDLLAWFHGSDGARFQGVYLEIDDAKGVPVFITSIEYFSGAGSQWTDPASPVDFGIAHG